MRLAHWVPQVKRVQPVCVETTDLQEDRARGAPPDPEVAQETRETLERTDPR